MTCTFDNWEPDLSGEGTEEPAYVHIPIVIIDDNYKARLHARNRTSSAFD
jgi:hypothetical protein